MRFRWPSGILATLSSRVRCARTKAESTSADIADMKSPETASTATIVAFSFINSDMDGAPSRASRDLDFTERNCDYSARQR
jgi:hypothetical protein